MAKFQKKKKEITPVLAEPIQRYEHSSMLSRKQILLNNFIGGIAWAVGTVVGLSLLIAVVSFIVAHVDLVPVVGNFIARILEYLEIQRALETR